MWVTPEEVAEVMIKLAEGGEIDVRKGEAKGKRKIEVQGGLVLEVGKESVRVVEQ